MENTSKDIMELFQSLGSEYSSQKNASGDMQSILDIKANAYCIQAFQKENLCSWIVSEEEENTIKTSGKTYGIALDPLDGSSVAGSGLSVGTLMAIYEAEESSEANGQTLCAAMGILYGATRFVWVATTSDYGVYTLDAEGNASEVFQPKLHNDTHISPGAFGELYKNAHYGAFLQHASLAGWKLRNSGSLATNLALMLHKEGGLYCYPGKKLRMLYECLPASLLMRQAGGKAQNIDGAELLSVPITNIHQSDTVLLGTPTMVMQASTFLRR